LGTHDLQPALELVSVIAQERIRTVEATHVIWDCERKNQDSAKAPSSMNHQSIHPKGPSPMEASNHSSKKVYHPWKHLKIIQKACHPLRHQSIHSKWSIIHGGTNSFIQKGPSSLEASQHSSKKTHHLWSDQKHHPNHVS
jgi:hypothetical protein